MAACHHFVKKKASEFYLHKTSNILFPEFLNHCGGVMEHKKIIGVAIFHSYPEERVFI